MKKYILIYLALTIALLSLAACGGGGGTKTPPPPLQSGTTYTLTFASGGNGTLTGTTIQTVPQGESSATVTAVPAAGYHFVNWTEGGVSVGVNAALTIPDVNANHSYVANFVLNSADKTTAILTMNLTGTLPANTGIAGTSFTVALPANVTPALTNGAVVNGVVTTSGTFAGGTQMPPVYTAATATAPGTLKIILANAVPAGITQVGEVAKITLQLANGAAPTAGSFVLSDISTIDAAYGDPISGMNAVIGGVTLQ